MSRRVAIWLGALAALGFAAPAHAFDLEAQAAIVSDYRWRGVSLSDEQASLQLEGSVSFNNGAWLWASANSISDVYGDAELGIGAGYDATFATLDWSLGVTAYVYPGADDLDYAELNASAGRSIGPMTVSGGLDYVPAQDNVDAESHYAWLGLAAEVGHVQLHGHIGYDDGFVRIGEQTLDYSLGASLAAGPWGADLSFVDSEAEDEAWVLRLSRTFAP